MNQHKQINIRQLNRYFKQVLRQIFNTHFIVKNIYEIPSINQLALSSEAKKIKIAHYLFMYLLTRDMKTHLIKYNIPTKYKKQVHRVRKNSKILVRLPSKITEYVLHILLFEVFAQIFTSERIVFKVNKHIVRLIIENVPLMEESLILQSTSGYLTHIPLILNFNIPYTTLYQKFFIIRGLKIYSSNLKSNLDIDESRFLNNLF